MLRRWLFLSREAGNIRNINGKSAWGHITVKYPISLAGLYSTGFFLALSPYVTTVTEIYISVQIVSCCA